VTVPKVETFSQFGNRMYKVPGLADAIGVTSVMKNIDKTFLGFARARESGEYSFDHMPALLPLYAEGDRKAFVDLVKGAASRKWGAAADLGTAVHNIFERLLLGEKIGTVHPDHQGFLEQAQIFIDEFDVEPIHVEKTCWNTRLNYAGTADAFAKVAGETIVLDLKTGASGIFPETALQLCAYANAEFLVEPDGTRLDLPEVEGAAALSLRPDHFSVVPCRIDEEVFSVFEHLVGVAAWQRGLSRSVLGPAVEAPKP
jgi:hypothetical protein